MWLLWSLISILFWSGSDLFCKMSSKPEDKISHLKIVMAVGGVMGIHAIFMLCMGMEFHLMDFVSYFPASFCYILSMVLGYIGLRYIELSVSTPICNSSGAVTVLLCIVFMHERMAGMQYFGMALVFVAILGLSFLENKGEKNFYADKKHRQRNSTVSPKKNAKAAFFPGVCAGGDETGKYTQSGKAAAILFSIGYCILDGLGTFVDAWLLSLIDGEQELTGTKLIDWFIQHPVTSEDAANTAYELTFLFMAVLAFLYVILVKKAEVKVKEEKTTLLAGICETAGQFAYIYALAAEPVLAAGVISAYCVFSVLWARVIIKEKLRLEQYLVIAVAVVGIVILGVYDA